MDVVKGFSAAVKPIKPCFRREIRFSSAWATELVKPPIEKNSIQKSCNIVRVEGPDLVAQTSGTQKI